MANDRRDANMKMLQEADDIQQKTKETVFRIQKQVAETQDIGAATLEELRKQGQQMDDINSELEAVDAKLDQSLALQNTFDKWAGNWFGIKKSKAHKEAAQEIAEANRSEHSKVKEVFQHEKYDNISRTWKSAGFVLCNNPTVSIPDVFDPALQNSESCWTIDYSLSGIDAEGWTYAYDFSTLNKVGAGDPTPKWNSYVRRRKWKFSEKKIGNSSAIESVRERNQARTQRAAAGSTQADKIGYVPRNRQTNLTASGLSSAGMSRSSKGEDLDEDSKRGLAKIKSQDAEIDEGIDNISNTLDTLTNIAGAMKEEVKSQNAKLGKMEDNMTKATEKQTVVNARQRHLLK